MKNIKTGVFLKALACLVSVTLTSQAGVYTDLHDFVSQVASDVSYPNGVVFYNGQIFGAATQGGTGGDGDGVLYTVQTNGVGFSSLHNFNGTPADGQSPNEVLVSGDMIYGTTFLGGTNGYGIIFKINTNGSPASYVILRSFTNNEDLTAPDAEYPAGGLVLSGATLYGTSYSGGTNNLGVVFKIDTNGANFTILHHFSTNSADGDGPQGRLILSGQTLYGTTVIGGTNNLGTVFTITTNGNGFSVLYSFSNAPAASEPLVGLTLGNNVLYGVSAYGGISNAGAVFQLGTDGSSFTIIHSFTNSDGVSAQCPLLFTNNLLYGAAYSPYTQGPGGGGTFFQVDTSGANFTLIKNFTNALTGVNPKGEFVLSGNVIYGTTSSGGPGDGSLDGAGMVYSLLLTPLIVTQPQSLLVTNGNPASFTVGVTDENAVTYQWYFNTNTPLNGQTAATLNLAAATNGNAGSYTVVARDNGGSVTSSPAVLTVVTLLPLPSITSQPSSLTVTNGNPASFNVSATNGTLSYQWYFNTNTLLLGQTGSTLNLAAATNGNAGTYTVVVSNTSGAVTSSPAVLTVVAPLTLPSITSQPSSLTVTNGNPAVFSVIAVNGTLTYQWYFNTNTVLVGQTNSSYTITLATTNLAGAYTVAVANGFGAVTSSPAVLTISLNSKPVINTQPQSQTIVHGDTASFTVVASGLNPLSYQWYSNSVSTAIGNALAGATSNVYAFTTTTNRNGNYYTVVVANTLGKATSNPALLTEIIAPVILTNPQPATVVVGNTATFTVTAIGQYLFYQWYSNSVSSSPGALLVGQTNTSYAFTPGLNSSGSYYTVVVTNLFGKVTSTPAQLTVTQPLPYITLQPLAVTITNGSSVTFTSAAAGPGTLGYQWLYQTNQLITGATNTGLTFPTANQPGMYSMKVTNNYGAATSSPALLTVVGRPIMLSSALDRASGSYDFSYVNLAGSTNRLLVTTNLANPAAWQAIATNYMATNGIWQYIDLQTAQTNSLRFYRFSSP